MSEKYEFLSPEWETKANEIVGSGNIENPTDSQLTINITISPTPFGDKTVSIVARAEGVELDNEHGQVTLFRRHNGYCYECNDARQSCSSRKHGKVNVDGF